ncbi:H+/Cl- antiporter ClcA [Catenulispora sp. EB89]|uniref:ion channel protein n=1 Tax=Catenulispora sp. EB89 TaxID=3156257 RepID=UPI0035150543
MATATEAPTAGSPARALLPLVVPAVVVGVGSSLLLILLSGLANRVQELLWRHLPGWLGVGAYSAGWVILVLTCIGALSGLVVWKAPGHAGPDPATTGLVDPPLAPGVLPGLALAVVLTLAGGVSLGPENPIIATNIALACWLGARVMGRVPAPVWLALAAAGTVGALFGTPVAAALILSESFASKPAQPSAPGQGSVPGQGSLWDKLFAPLVAAGAGAMTTQLISHPEFAMPLPTYDSVRWVDLLTAALVASLGAVVAMVAVYAFPLLHRAFNRLRQPVVRLTLGGLVLGLLGALGGKDTLFKGLSQVKDLAEHPDGHSAAGFAGLALVRLAALTFASSAGFRGGRIFPAVFAGAALGFAAHALVSTIPVTLAVACGVLGVLLAVTRSGWVSLFTAAVLGGGSALLPILCVALLPAWLLVTGRPEMELPKSAAAPAPGHGPGPSGT